jgi:hypothetical protein
MLETQRLAEDRQHRRAALGLTAAALGRAIGAQL